MGLPVDAVLFRYSISQKRTGVHSSTVRLQVSLRDNANVHRARSVSKAKKSLAKTVADATMRLEGFEVLEEDLQYWLNFFTFGATTPEDKMTQLLEKSPAVLAAYEEFKRFTLNEEMRDLERRRRRFLEDQHIYVSAATAKGKEEGKAEEKFEIARNMKRKEYDVEAIAELTGLSHVEIEHLD